MEKIHLPLKVKVKAIQQKNTDINDLDPEIKDSTLKINLGNMVKKKGSVKEDDELLHRIHMLEESLQQAREEAFKTGIEEGKEQLKNEIEAQLLNESKALKVLLKNLSGELKKEIKKLQPAVLNLSLGIAEKILNRALSDNESANEILKSQIGRILHELMDQETITIHVSPLQIEWIIKANIEEEFRLPGTLKIKFYEDRNLRPGECILESTNILIEGKFKEQLKNLEAQLLNL
ncbi:MAG: hypothetical protein JXQ65_07370 [Candidatus Marinimicrobia bacterium]|nr:hypothetical protein [Candidatus Neomarinimicrobiota bacterium]